MDPHGWLGRYLKKAKVTAFFILGMPFLLIYPILPSYGGGAWILWEEVQVDTGRKGSTVNWYVKDATENKSDCDSLVPRYMALRLESLKVPERLEREMSNSGVTLQNNHGEIIKYRLICLPGSINPKLPRAVEPRRERRP